MPQAAAWLYREQRRPNTTSAAVTALRFLDTLLRGMGQVRAGSDSVNPCVLLGGGHGMWLA